MKAMNRWQKTLATTAFLAVFSFWQINFVFAETVVSGTILTDTTWATAGSPYIVTGKSIFLR